MRNYPEDSSNTTNTPRSWLGLKEAGRQAYDRGDYTQALNLYRTALQPEYECARTADRQVILSNIVACRLQLGGNVQAEAAVTDAKQCVALNRNWPKGHVRLASAYAALGKSNDACNSLQTALRLDPGNRTARDMLVRELRRERVAPTAAATNNIDNDENAPPPPPPPPQNPDYVPPSRNNNNTSNARRTAAFTPAPGQGQRVEINVDDEGWSWQDRLRFYRAQILDAYNAQSNEVRSLIKAVLCFVVIYVAFGGRFGLTSTFTAYNGSSSRPMQGNYGTGNAYDQFYRDRASSNSFDNSYARQSAHSRDSYQNDYYNNHDDYYSGGYGHGRGGGSSYYGYSGSSWETSLPSIALIAAIVYACHLAGINPFHALLMLNAVRGGRGRYRGRFGGLGGVRRRRRPGAGFYW